jgi:hypothetical protein
VEHHVWHLFSANPQYPQTNHTIYEQSNSFKNDTSLCALHRKKTPLKITQTSHGESQLSGKIQADEGKNVGATARVIGVFIGAERLAWGE